MDKKYDRGTYRSNKKYNKYTNYQNATEHTNINGERAIKPYYYFRNSLLHVRYNVDRAIKLSPDEAEQLKYEMSQNGAYKQDVLAKEWDFMEHFVHKDIIKDGTKAIEEAFLNRDNRGDN